MTASGAMMKIATANDPKAAIMKILGDVVDKTEVMTNNILVAYYIESEKTAGGIIKVQQTIKESEWQGKVFLVLKLGKMAYEDDERTKFRGQRVKPGDWVICRNSDGLDLKLGASKAASADMVKCKFVEEAHIRAIVPSPDVIY